MRVIQHVNGFNPDTKGTSGHVHMNYSANADLNTDGVHEGDITFAGTSVAVTFDNHKGHYHIDFTEELQKLRDSVLAGDYAAR